MIKIIDTDYRFLVDINKLFNIKQTINDQLNKLLNKNYINNLGYLQEIIKINSFDIKDISKSNFKSEIFIDVNFKGKFINPDIDSIIECVVIDNNNNTIFAISNSIIKVIIIDENIKVKVGQIVKVKVKSKDIKLNNIFINAVCSIVKN